MINRTFNRAVLQSGFIRALVLLSGIVCFKAAYSQVNLPSLGDSMSGIISSQQEHEFGREILRQIRREAPMLDDPLVLDYISNLSYHIASYSELTDLRLDFVLIDNRTLNAFAVPGGVIGVHAGLFEYAENEGQFASVIAHEIAHVSQRHFARNQEMARRNALPSLAAMVAGIVLASTTDGDAGAAAISASQAMAVDSALRYSRSNESEADRVGIRNLHRAGFDPNDMAGMFENMLRLHSYNQKIPEFLSSHPLDETRIADSRNRALSMPPVQPVYDVEYGLMRERIRVHYEEEPEIIISARTRALNQLNGKEADAARYGLALAYLKNRQYDLAEDTLQILLDKEPRRITYVMLQADIARESGRIDYALSILEDNLKINPSNHPLTMNYALTLEEAGQFDKAAQVLTRQAEKRPNDMQLWYHLAEIQGQAGNISMVHLARAEYYFAIGDFRNSNAQLEFAMDQADDPLVMARIRNRQNEMRQVQNRFYE